MTTCDGNCAVMEVAVAFEDEGEIDVDHVDEEMPVIQLEPQETSEGCLAVTTQVEIVDDHDDNHGGDSSVEGNTKIPMASRIRTVLESTGGSSSAFSLDDYTGRDVVDGFALEGEQGGDGRGSHDRPMRRRPAVIGLMMIVPTSDTIIGLEIVQENKGIIVAHILPNSLLARSPLRNGDKIVSVNGKQCDEMTCAQVQAELLQYGERQRQQPSCPRYLKLVATTTSNNRHHHHSAYTCSNLVASMITKSKPNRKLGIALRSFDGIVQIRFIEPHGLADKSSSLLNVGDTILSVNDIPCIGLSAREVLDIMEDAPQYVTILTRAGPNTAVVLTEVSASSTQTISMDEDDDSYPPLLSDRMVCLLSTCPALFCCGIFQLCIMYYMSQSIFTDSGM